ncbi:C6 finger domain protein, putative [Cordyceps militaris CM01]|uniref:C6 finger domain protein, putative n=1 Tax=Cordyceps militaris (strain CM01) TaxID=983644 RepID=G3JF88_CORMM|nr:C6 finger domain protein, putative [Cordyceps militaris CM01]EGX93528.1 C6 finger domain protein, putative [Cordyceps militaris CM01]
MDFESPEGCRAFDYYRSQSAPVLGNIMDSEFWGGLVMRLSVTEPIVRHAVLAMSSLHEHLSTHREQGDTPGPSFIYSEYGKSIAALRQWKSSDGPTIPLLACVLYTCLEFLLDNEQAARMHIIEGRKLLGSLGDESSPALEMVKRDLVPMYTRLGLAAFLYGGNPPGVPEHLRPSIAPPTKFESIAEARALLYHLLDEALRFTTAVRPKIYAGHLDASSLQDLASAQQALLSRLTHWHVLFIVLTSGLKMTQANVCTQNLLLIYYNTAVIWVSTSLRRDEVAYDAHMPAFSTIVSLGAAIIAGAQRGSPLHSFSFETELIAPIYWTVQKCRHPLLRRAAVKLLMKDELKNRRENLWHSNEAVAIALRTIEVEEEHTARCGVVMESAVGLSPEHHGTPHSEASSRDSNRSGWHVPLGHPPTLSLGQIEEEQQLEELLNFNTIPSTAGGAQSGGSLVDVLHVGVEATQLQSPYGVMESSRIKNTLIGARDKAGVTVTIFRDPQNAQDEWDVRKEFIPFL